MIEFSEVCKDRLTPRQRLSHKLRDGKYRARQAGNPVEDISIYDVLYWLDDMRCYYCKIRLFSSYALEHKTPLAAGGGHTKDNICPACMDCNTLKHTMTEAEFLDWTKG